ncbi:uncharacterized protein [Chelonus insularis]|uniref:uncharacterized protein n=1 Tax=Chelonus insularis TaxID=460826 RepID=UPI00158E78ED|nr:uncharacterized protein LOC118070055 [Chelonus insularis]
MVRYLLGFVMAASTVAYMSAQTPKPYIIINTIDIKNAPNNNWFGTWKGVIESGGEILSVDSPVLRDLPDDTMIAVIVELSGQVVLDFKSTVCDALEDESFGKEIVKYAEPKGQFPEECPFIKGEDFKIKKYEIPQDKLPQNTQPGAMHAEVKIYTVSEDDPEIFLVADGEIILK